MDVNFFSCEDVSTVCKLSEYVGMFSICWKIWQYSTSSINFTMTPKGLEDTIYHQISNISLTFEGNKIVDHSDVVGTVPVGAAPTTSFILDLTPGFNRLHKDNCKTRREIFKCWDLVSCIRDLTVGHYDTCWWLLESSGHVQMWYGINFVQTQYHGT